ncbi:PDR/VanB family oxidoreductase [Streptomyces sp. ME19-01-6]|uniref:PDR/VanB family oxidoreductase n=1 Tax=Streptomyces sp. ME19-01-6 TaxID=3028686 RepID=UPI0029B1F684|nr:PDR/VanB family oxidoreductase [Streptomyces sp. ME19-01-6]MDX3225115.1 PDR/VanB family oxidoreductase [Streptomyces sp. ME19-01-6]
MNSPEYESRLVIGHRVDEAAGVISLTLRHPDGEELPTWEPGAHIDLLLEDGLVRQYSLCGDPGDRGAWQIAVLREPAGRGGSAYVHDQLTEGTSVRVRGPRNNFALVPADRYLFVAGGIGITPILPMVAAAEAAGTGWTLLYGGRSRTSMAFADRLTASYGDRVRVTPEDEYGLLDLASHLAAPSPGTLVYCCGPEPLLKAVEERCADSWPAGALRVERFKAKEIDADAPSGSFDVVLQQSGLTVTVPPDRSILRAVEEAGVQVLYSCAEGTCGTCETDIIEGEAAHRDSVLTPQEQAANETMMICVSRCAGGRLVLDL